jgi:hypothetical protein
MITERVSSAEHPKGWKVSYRGEWNCMWWLENPSPTSPRTELHRLRLWIGDWGLGIGEGGFQLELAHPF